MIPEIVEVNACKDFNKQVDLLCAYFLSGKITFDNIAKCTISGGALNALGVRVYQTPHPSNIVNAMIIYEMAIKKQSKWAMYNLANLLINSSIPEHLKRAYVLYTELYSNQDVFKNDEHAKNIICLYTAYHHYIQGQFGMAWRIFIKIPSEILIQGEKTAWGHYPLVINALESIKTLSFQKLNEISYKSLPVTTITASSTEQADDGVAELTQGIQRLTHNQTPSPWTRLSNSIDMFDAYQRQDVIIAYTAAQLEYDMAVQNTRLAQHAHTLAQSEGKPSFILTMLGELATSKSQLQGQKSAILTDAKKAHSDLWLTGYKKELRRQTQSEKHFFAIERNQKGTVRDLAEYLLSTRQQRTPAALPPNIAGVPTRRIIAAELAAIRASLMVMGTPLGYNYVAFPWMVGDKKTRHTYNSSYVITYGPLEEICYNTSVIQYRQRLDPHYNHLGDFFMVDLDTYAVISQTLIQLIMTEGQRDSTKERQLARWMLRYTKHGQPMTQDELMQLQPDLSGEAITALIDKVTRIFYHCFVKEPASWMICCEDDRELPLAVAQLRAVRLISEGYLHIGDVFGADSSYGVFTGTNIKGENFNVLKQKVERINKFYTDLILLGKEDNRSKHFLFTQEHPKATPVSTRQELHEELVDVFGGDSDTDGEGYDSDIAESLYPSTYFKR